MLIGHVKAISKPLIDRRGKCEALIGQANAVSKPLVGVMEEWQSFCMDRCHENGARRFTA